MAETTGIEWRYFRTTVVHALQPNIFSETGRDHVAACGAVPPIGDDWYGTGTQIEYEMATNLRPCKRCLRCLHTLGLDKEKG